MSTLKKWADEKKVTTSPTHIAAEQCLDSIKEYFDSSICRDHLDRPIQTKCGHVFCSKCLQDLSKEPNATCPLCKVKISNRSLIVREDVEDMKNIVARLSEAFRSELEKYFDWKVRPQKKSSSGASTGTVAKKIEGTPKAGTSSKTTEQTVSTKDQAGTESGSVSHLDEVAVEENHEWTGDSKRIKRVRENNEHRTSVDSDDLEQHITESPSAARKQKPSIDAAELSGKSSSNKSAELMSEIQMPLNIRSNEQVAARSEISRDISSSSMARDAMLEKMRKQTYVIMDSGIETVPAKNKSQSPGKPLDLSLSRRRSSQFTEFVYTEKPITIRYVKPLDLSMKKKNASLNMTTPPQVLV